MDPAPSTLASLDATVKEVMRAIKFLKLAIARHERHISGEEATDSGSQQKMMDDMMKALEALQGNGEEEGKAIPQDVESPAASAPQRAALATERARVESSPAWKAGDAARRRGTLRDALERRDTRETSARVLGLVADRATDPATSSRASQELRERGRWAQSAYLYGQGRRVVASDPVGKFGFAALGVKRPGGSGPRFRTTANGPEAFPKVKTSARR